MSTEILSPSLSPRLFQEAQPYVVIWLLELDLGPMVVRLAPVDLVIEDDVTGEEIFFYSGLQEVGYEEILRMFETMAASIDATFSTLLPPHAHELILRGGTYLARAKATLCRWVYGSPYSSRAVKMTGYLRDPEYGAIEVPVNATIAGNLWQDTTPLPARTLRVEGVTWSQAHGLEEEDLTRAYPIIYGTPGRVSTRVSSRGRVAGSKARLVMDEAMLSGGKRHDVLYVIAGHHVTTERVYIVNNDDTVGARVCVLNGHDGRGQPVALLPWWYSGGPEGYPYEYDSATMSGFVPNRTEVDATMTHAIGDGGAVPVALDQANSNPATTPWVCWVDDIDGPGHGGKGQAGQLIREAGDVLVDLLSQTALPVDMGRCEAAAGKLARFKLDFAIESGTTPWDTIKTRIAPMLPVSFRTGPRGVHFIVWNTDAVREDAVAHISAEWPDVDAMTKITQWTDRITNDFWLNYARSARTGKFQARRRLWSGEAQWAPSPPTVEDEDILVTEQPNFYCRRSQASMRGVDGRPLHIQRQINTDVIYDDATAGAVLLWQAKAFWGPIRKTRYRVAERYIAGLSVGDVILVSDPAVGLDRQVAFLEGIDYDVGIHHVRISIVLWDDPFLSGT